MHSTSATSCAPDIAKCFLRQGCPWGVASWHRTCIVEAASLRCCLRGGSSEHETKEYFSKCNRGSRRIFALSVRARRSQASESRIACRHCWTATDHVV